MGQEKGILGANSFGDRRSVTAEIVSLELREKISVIASVCITASCPGDQGTPRGSPEWVDIMLPWAGPVLLSWAGFLGWRELMATRQLCRETAVPRSSSSAKHSRAEGTACRQQGGRIEAERG